MDIDNSSSENDACSFDESPSDTSDDELAELCIIGMVYDYNEKFLNKTKVRTSALTGRDFITKILNGSGTVCFELFRMEKTCFINFCNELRGKSYLSDSRDVLLEEKVAMFLFIIGHNVRHRVVADRFQHSTETISRYFKEVLRANCLGAIDGTHISAWVPAEKQTSCR
ncbi:uncharacterized protein LOC133286101, partial [Gastrolobium bilobum]|uniref:uncharacterized protein LOC133286101 n=1 Tax=Gastrolobium bilobum TaxID=150636 RepID=UPI002AB1CCAD